MDGMTQSVRDILPPQNKPPEEQAAEHHPEVRPPSKARTRSSGPSSLPTSPQVTEAVVGFNESSTDDDRPKIPNPVRQHSSSGWGHMTHQIADPAVEAFFVEQLLDEQERNAQLEEKLRQAESEYEKLRRTTIQRELIAELRDRAMKITTPSVAQDILMAAKAVAQTGPSLVFSRSVAAIVTMVTRPIHPFPISTLKVQLQHAICALDQSPTIPDTCTEDYLALVDVRDDLMMRLDDHRSGSVEPGSAGDCTGRPQHHHSPQRNPPAVPPIQGFPTGNNGTEPCSTPSKQPTVDEEGATPPPSGRAAKLLTPMKIMQPVAASNRRSATKSPHGRKARPALSGGSPPPSIISVKSRPITAPVTQITSSKKKVLVQSPTPAEKEKPQVAAPSPVQEEEEDEDEAWDRLASQPYRLKSVFVTSTTPPRYRSSEVKPKGSALQKGSTRAHSAQVRSERHVGFTASA